MPFDEDAASVRLAAPWRSSRQGLSAPAVVFSLVVGLILLFLILPTLIVIPMSIGTATYIEFPPQGLTMRWYKAYLGDPDWTAATLFSLRVALATTTLATVTGTLAAIALVRGNLPGKAAIQGLILSPMVMPHI